MASYGRKIVSLNPKIVSLDLKPDPFDRKVYVGSLIAFMTRWRRERKTMQQSEEQKAPDVGSPEVQETGGRLQQIQSVVAEVSESLAQFESQRQALEALRTTISEEFESRIDDNAAAAERDRKLEAATSRLLDLESERQILQDKSRGQGAKLKQLELEHADLMVAHNFSEKELTEIRPELEEKKAKFIELNKTIASLERDNSSTHAQRNALLEEAARLTNENVSISDNLTQVQGNLVAESDRLVDALTRCETLQVRVLRAESALDNANAALGASRDHISTLDDKFSAAELAAERNISAIQCKYDACLIELDSQQAKLDDAQTRAARLEEKSEKLSRTLKGLNITTNTQQREISTVEIELSQLRDRTQTLEAALDEAKRQAADVDAARIAAVQRSDSLSKALMTMEQHSQAKDAEIKEKDGELRLLLVASEEKKAQDVVLFEEYQTVAAQQKAEIDMLRGAVGFSERRVASAPANGVDPMGWPASAKPQQAATETH